jgi:hypothetical protein
VNYDASDAAPSSKAELNSLQTRRDTVPWQEAIIRCSVADLDGTILKHKVRQGLVPNTDVKTYDAGNFIVVTSGVTTSPAFLGDLWVDYDVELFSPKQVDGMGGLVNSGGTVSTAAPLGSAPISSGFLPGSQTSGTTFTFNQTFEGLVIFTATGASGASNFSGTAVRGTPIALLDNYTHSSAYVAVSATIGQTIVFGPAGTITDSQVVITPGPFDVLTSLIL